MDHFCAINVGITALAITTPTSKEYWTWSIIPEVSPKTLAMVPNVRPVLIRRVVYIVPWGMNFLERKKTPTNLLINFRPKSIRNRPRAEKISGKDTLNPPTMKKVGVIIAYATVRSLFLTDLVSEVSLKCGDINNPSTNAGSTA